MTATDNGEGFAMLPNWIARTGYLDPAAFMLYAYLLGRANKAGQCWPSLTTIERETGISKRTIQRALDRLEERGVVRRTARRSEAGDRDSTLYTVTVFSMIRPAGLGGRGDLATRRGDMTTPPEESTTRSASFDQTGLVKVAKKLEPEITRSTQPENEVAPTARHDDRGRPTPAQLRYLADLTTLAGDGVPTDQEWLHWADNLTAAEVSARIDEHLRCAGRGLDYLGPVPGDPAFDALSERGKALAENEMIPGDNT